MSRNAAYWNFRPLRVKQFRLAKRVRKEDSRKRHQVNTASRYENYSLWQSPHSCQARRKSFFLSHLWGFPFWNFKSMLEL